MFQVLTNSSGDVRLIILIVSLGTEINILTTCHLIKVFPTEERTDRRILYIGPLQGGSSDKILSEQIVLLLSRPFSYCY